MKAKKLIEQLKEFPPDEEIYLASDEEGNNIYTVDGMVINEIQEGVNLAVIYPTNKRVDWP